ncbi:hypothetical protein C7999DRAFT_14545 [Corynascus novoguineensis]|uniref:Zn(2)-C6 fungal-type domain-containing protein n=1 Tax=Corynascus novoguineensis TaxID=1126955 RepID=A0AAN7HF81_9PEZI|nr:hypothetical protein C7999DRAFT_14545 [Corynascus novoguineensis]
MDGMPITPTIQSSESVPRTANVNPSTTSLLGASQRKERGAIAAQACDTCRSRKQRCDEQRPKCGTCQKFRLECNYREPQPTKKDKTLVEILDRIKGLEGKLDNLSQRTAIGPPASVYSVPISLPSPLAAAQAVLGQPLPGGSSYAFPGEASGVASEEENHYQYVTSVHQMLKWPAVQQLIASIRHKIPDLDLSCLEKEGPASVAATRRCELESLPKTVTKAIGQGPTMNMDEAVTAQGQTTITDLTWDAMQRLSKAYFDSFNLLCPILNRLSFMSETLPALFNNGVSDDISSAIVLLVFALGEVAIAGSEGPPVHMYNGRASGIKGGTKDEPPGLELFNEARRRVGCNLTECSLENVQMFQLASIYYGTCFHPFDFWRMTTFASTACQALIASHPSALSSSEADLMRRAFWHCSIIETGLKLELCCPLTGLERMESIVGLPDFSGPYSEEDYMSNQESHFQEHFASQIVLRRLLVDFHAVLSQGNSLYGQISAPYHPAPPSTGPNRSMIRQQALQLEQWRGMLPVHLRWQDDAPGAYPDGNTNNTSANLYSTNASLFTPATTPVTSAMPTAAQQQQTQQAQVQPSVSGSTAATPLMFTTDLDAPPPRYPYVLDIQVALLRSRYYYTKYLIHRPFIYKALHHPDAMEHDDAVGVAECLKAALKWPVAMSPTCRQKRLIPCSFFFTQNFFGILVLLHLSSTVPILGRIRSTLCGERFEIDASETVGLYLDWLRDLKEVDRGAVWFWEIVKAMYGLEDD